MKNLMKWFPFCTYDLCDNHTRPVVVCFHHAGGSAAYYRNWTLKKENLNFVSVELPGKGTRMEEEFLNNFEEMKASLCEAINKIVNGRQYAVYGHSMGAAMAFYVADYMVREYDKEPEMLIVAGRQAPDTEDEKEFKSYMDDDALIYELERYQATPAEILEDRELLNFFLPSIRRDYELNDSLQYRGERIGVPIIAHAGTEDEGADGEIMAGWKRMTTSEFELQEFDGGHFFIAPENEKYFKTLVRQIENKILGGVYEI